MPWFCCPGHVGIHTIIMPPHSLTTNRQIYTQMINQELVESWFCWPLFITSTIPVSHPTAVIVSSLRSDPSQPTGLNHGGGEAMAAMGAVDCRCPNRLLTQLAVSHAEHAVDSTRDTSWCPELSNAAAKSGGLCCVQHIERGRNGSCFCLQITDIFPSPCSCLEVPDDRSCTFGGHKSYFMVVSAAVLHTTASSLVRIRWPSESPWWALLGIPTSVKWLGS